MTAVRPQWEWELAGPDGGVLDRPLSPAFTTRYDAEEWLGAQWRTLRDQGAATAVLRNEGRLVPPAYPLEAPGR
ncbi:MAG TPA: hypothetical protein VGC57_06800 [Cellulomonas sp.]